MFFLEGLRQAVRRRGVELLGSPPVLRVLAIPGVADAVTRVFVLRARLVNAAEGCMAVLTRRSK
jgi:hypothetical protein